MTAASVLSAVLAVGALVAYGWRTRDTDDDLRELHTALGWDVDDVTKDWP